MSELDNLAKFYGTDKSSQGHSYTRFYEMVFAHLRNEPINLLEIGIWEGASLRMWSDYFSSGTIVGIDIYEKTQYRNERIDTLILDQSNKSQLERFGNEFHNEFDIMIDDGSHEADHQILTFETLFPHLKSGGYYCIEDVLCSYDKLRWGAKASIIDRIKQMVDEVNMSGNISNSHICANKIEQVKKYTGSYFDLNIEYIFVSTGLCIIKKI